MKTVNLFLLTLLLFCLRGLVQVSEYTYAGIPSNGTHLERQGYIVTVTLIVVMIGL